MGGAIFQIMQDAVVAREELGPKRVDPETGKKFYDLGKDPIVSPYTGKSYPRSYFEEPVVEKPRKEPAAARKEEPAEAEEETEEDEAAPEFVPLEEADEGADESEGEDEELPDLPDVDIDVEEDEEAEEDVFLEEEEGEDDLSDVISGVDGEEEV